MSGLGVALTRAAGSASFLRLHVFLSRIHDIAFRIAIMMPYPGHAVGQAVLVAALGDKVEVVVRAHQNIHATPKTGKGMKDFARRILGKDAEARSFFAREFADGVVVLHLAAGSFLRREGNVIVEIEIAVER